MGWAVQVMEWGRPLPVQVVLAYLIGSIPFSYLVAKTQGVDLRNVGSGNTGASNVWRACGFRYFLVALILDGLKGFVPTAITYRVLHNDPLPTVVVAVAALVGHALPVFIRFRGGKIVASNGGVLLAIEPILFLVAAVAWLIVFRLTSYASAASLASMVIVAVTATTMAVAGFLDPAFFAFIWVSLIAMVYLHRANIERLLRGTENRIERKAK